MYDRMPKPKGDQKDLRVHKSCQARARAKVRTNANSTRAQACSMKNHEDDAASPDQFILYNTSVRFKQIG